MADYGRVLAGFPRRPVAPGLARDWQERAIYQALEQGLLTRRVNRESYRTDVNRNDIAEELLKSDAEWLWMCDEDVMPPPTAIGHMVKRATDVGADVLAALVLARDGRPVFFDRFINFEADKYGIPIPYFHCAFDAVLPFMDKYKPDPPWSNIAIPDDEAVMPLAGVGTGCILIHRRVFEQVKPPWFFHWAGDIGDGVYAAGEGTEDLAFSYYAGVKHGIKIFGDCSVFCGHLERASVGLDEFYAALRATRQRETSPECGSEDTGAKLAITPTGNYRRDYDVDIVVVGWGNVDKTRALLDSIEQNTYPDRLARCQVTYVDNGSNVQDVSALIDDHLGLQVIRLPFNHGFCRGVNAGLALAHLSPSRFVLLMNNDTRIQDGDVGWLDRMIAYFDEDATVGMVGAVSNWAMKSQLEQSDRPRDVKPESVVAASFLAAMLRKSAMAQVGGLDERFEPGQYDDLDYSLRLREAGWRLLVAKDVWVHHEHSATFSKVDFVRIQQANLDKLAAKWGSKLVEMGVAQVAQEYEKRYE